MRGGRLTAGKKHNPIPVPLMTPCTSMVCQNSSHSGMRKIEVVWNAEPAAKRYRNLPSVQGADR